MTTEPLTTRCTQPTRLSAPKRRDPANETVHRYTCPLCDRERTRLSIAREHAGVNNNLLAPGDFVDVLSGNAAVNGIPVEVSPA